MKKLLTASSVPIFALLVILTGNASALSASYNHIIDNSVFDNSSSMDASQIDAFLNTFPNSCISTNNGFSAPDPTGYNPISKYTYGNNVSAGTVIYDAAQAYGINPQVLLVTLQKEQGLVAGDGANVVRNPSRPGDCGALAISASLGYNCPDGIQLTSYSGFTLYAYRGTPVTSVNNTCVRNAAYVGFSRQAINASWLFTFDRHRSEGQNNWYVNKPNWDNSDDLGFCYSGYDAAGGPYYLCPDQNSHASDPYISHSGQYNIDSTVVTMTNGATAALFDYTPHLHGQDLFATNFTSWFGSTTQFNGTVQLSSSLNITKQPISYAGDTISANYIVSNTASYPVDVGGLGICARLNGINYDFGFQNMVSLPANGSTTISYSRVIDKPGILTVFLCSYNEHIGGWANDTYPYPSGPYLRQSTFEVRRNPVMSTGLTLSPTNPTLYQPVTATFTVTNNSSSPITIPAIGVAARDSANNNVGFASDTNVVIGANSTYTYNKTRTFTGNPGAYHFWVTSLVNGGWDDAYPIADGVARSLNATIYTNPAITTSLSLSPANPTLNQAITATFIVTNNSSSPITIPAIGVAARNPAGANVGFASDENVTVPANGNYTYSKTRTFTSSPGTYSFWVTSFINSSWNDTYPAALGGVVRSFTQKIYDNPLITTGLSLSPTNPTLNQSITATFTITNNSSGSVSIAAIGVAARDSTNNNVGFVSDINVTIPAGSTYTYSKSRTFTGSPGSYRFWITSLVNGAWDDNYPAILDGQTRSLNATLTL